MLRAAAAAMSPNKRPTSKRVSVKAKHGIRYRAMFDAYLKESEMLKISVEIPDTLAECLWEICPDTDNLQQVVREALQLYAAARTAEKTGGRAIIRNGEGKEMPCFVTPTP